MPRLKRVQNHRRDLKLLSKNEKEDTYSVLLDGTPLVIGSKTYSRLLDENKPKKRKA
jgi:hypothetical protein